MPGRAAGKITSHTASVRLGAERVRGVDQVARDVARHIGDHHQLLEEGAEENDGDPLLDADADPQDEQRHERGDREIADEVDQRLERRLHDAVGAHVEPQRHRDERGNGEPDQHHPDARPHVHPQGAVGGEREAARHHRVGGGQKHVGDQPVVGHHRPAAEERDQITAPAAMASQKGISPNGVEI